MRETVVRFCLFLFVSLSAVMGMTSASTSQDEIKPIEISGYVGGFTDLRDRGLSLSDQDPAAVASVVFDHKSGLYTGAFGAVGLDTPTGFDEETEFFAGYAFAADAYVIDLSAELDIFHGQDSRTFPEFKARVSRDFGLAYIRAGVSFAPDGRWFTPDRDSLYTSLDVELPVPTIPEATIITRFGYDFRENRADIADWAVGISYFLGDFELSLTLEDSAQDGPAGETNIIAGLRFFF